MKLAVLGGADTTGSRFVRMALSHGYSVTMLTQTAPAITHKNLSVIIGSCQDENAVSEALSGAHAVVTLPDVTHSNATLQLLISCMYAYDTRRLIVATTLESLRPHTNELNLAQILKRTSLDWTIVHSASDAMQSAGIATEHFNLTVSARDVGAFLVKQITDVTHLQSAVMLTD